MVVKKKKKFFKSRELKGVKVKFLVELKFGFKFIFGYLFFIRFDMDFLWKIYLEIEEEFEIYIEDLKLDIVLWRLIFFGSDSILNVFWVGFEYGLGFFERKLVIFFLEFEFLVVCKEEVDDGNILDS